MSCVLYRGSPNEKDSVMDVSRLQKKAARKAIILFLATLLLSNTLTGQNWFDSNWNYRVPVTITNNGSSLTDFQVPVSLGASFSWIHTNSDGSDIRFTGSDGETELSFWVETWTFETSATIWVKVPSLAFGETTIYIYYGNASATTSPSSGENTFMFFDDFAQGTIDATKWITVGSPSLSIIEDDGSNVLRVVAPGQHFYYLASIREDFTDFILEMKVKMQYDLNNQCTPEIAFRYTDNSNNYISMLRGEGLVGGGGPSGDLFIRRYESGVQTNPTPYPAYDYTAGYYYKYKIAAHGSTIEQHLDGNLLRSWDDAGTGILTGGIGIGNYGNNSYAVYYDDVRIRSFASPEPMTGLGFEQNQYPPLNISYTRTNVSCFGGSDGAIDVTVSGGSGVYEYLWTPGNYATEDISGIPAGTYHLYVEDTNGQNIGNIDVIITEPDPLVPAYTVVVPFDCVTGLATLNITASGGTPPYTGTGTFQQSTGTTEYTVADAIGCNAVISVTVGIESSWYDSQWQHRQMFDIVNPGGVPLSDFQMQVLLDDSFDFTRANPEGSDIRFTTSDGMSLIPYWIERWNEPDSAIIWIRMSSIPAAGESIYMYYGNPSVQGNSNGTTTFDFFDDFTVVAESSGNWIRRLLWTGSDWSGYVEHDWKYSMEMQHGALHYAVERYNNGWSTESLDQEIEDEFDYIHSQLNPDGTVVPDTYLNSEPQYCYGLLMANLSLGYMYFEDSNPVLATRCYNDLILVFDRLRVTYPTVGTLSDAGGYGFLLLGFSGAWKAFNHNNNDAVRAGQAVTIVETYADTFISNQATSGAWTGAGGVQEHEKRDFGVLCAYDVTGETAYLDAVNSNIEYILSTFWVAANGGLEWYANPSTSNHFYECHQQWFMIAVRMLYNRSGGSYDYLAEGMQAWHFLTDNNHAGIDMYVHNYVNHDAFFSYRQVLETGAYQSDNFKGSYELGAALYGMALNYSWVSDYQSSHSSQAFNYLDELVKQIKKAPSEKGFLSIGAIGPSSSLWQKLGNPISSIVDDNGNNVLSIRGNRNHTDLFTTVEQSFDNFVLEARVLMTADGNLLSNPAVDFRFTDVNNRYMTQLRGETQNDLFLRRYHAGVPVDLAASPFNFTANQYYDYKIVAANDIIRVYLNNDIVVDYVDSGTGILSGGISLRNYEDDYAAWFDDVRIRKYAAQEPYTVKGEEQTPNRWTGSVSSDWNDPANWNNGIPGICSLVTLADASPYQPHITGEAECFHLTVSNGFVTYIDPAGSLTLNGDLMNSGQLIIGSTIASSGSLIVNGTSTGNITYNRQLKPGSDEGSDWHLAAPPVATNSDANTGKVSTVYEWSETAGTWTSTGITSTLPGHGYNIRQEEASDGTISFTGPIVTNDLTVEASSPYADAIAPDESYFDRTYVAGRSLENPGGKGWNLLGNPYPSAINASAFIGANYSATRSLSQFDPNYVALYLFDGTERRYYYLANSTGWPSGEALSETHVQAGQGFFVLAMNDNAEFQFTRAMQEHSTGTAMLKSSGTEAQSLKSGDTDDRWPGLQLKATHATGEVLTTVVYNGAMTTGVDPGYDVGLFKSGQDIELYTALAVNDNGVNYTRQALPVSGADTLVIPVGVDFKDGGEVTFSAETVPVDGRRFWLEDRVAESFTDLSLKSYTVTLPADSYGTGRFFIIASTNTPTDINRPEAPEGDLRIWISGDRLVIQGEIGDGSVCGLFDLQGRKLLEQRLADGGMNIVELPVGLHGVVLVRVIDGTVVITRKLVIP